MTAWNFKDLTGMKFGRLTVIERAENKGKHACWKCCCDCGNEIVTLGYSLRKGKTQSCGCLQKDLVVTQNKTHGMRHTKTYCVWQGIKDRCFNSNHKYYSYYGGRGITIYPAWADDFQAFYDYVSRLPHFGEEGYMLDRIDNNGNYEPNNLRWADRKTQNRNTRKNVVVEYKGKLMTLSEVSEHTGIKYITLHRRYKRGDRGDRLFRPVTSSTKS